MPPADGRRNCAVHRDSYAAIFGGETLRTLVAASVAESIHEKNFFIIRHLLSPYERDVTVRRTFRAWARRKVA